MEVTEVSALWSILSAIQWALLVLGIVESFNSDPAESATTCNNNNKNRTGDHSRHGVNWHKAAFWKHLTFRKLTLIFGFLCFRKRVRNLPNTHLWIADRRQYFQFVAFYSLFLRVCLCWRWRSWEEKMGKDHKWREKVIWGIQVHCLMWQKNIS